MIINGYALQLLDGTQVQWFSSLPGRIDLPNSYVIFGVQDGWSDDTYKFVTATQEIPDPPVVVRQIDKATILDRITDAQLAQALSLMTPRQMERWRMPGYPSINIDDPDLLSLLQAIGADPKVVLA